MGIRRGFLIVMLLIFAGMALSACHTPAGRSAGQVVDDASITTVVKTKIFNDKKLSGLAISVSTFQGEVTLTGAVNSQSEKDLAESLARNTDEVKSVNNMIRIKP